MDVTRMEEDVGFVARFDLVTGLRDEKQDSKRPLGARGIASQLVRAPSLVGTCAGL